jgi:hypothetical protein
MYNPGLDDENDLDHDGNYNNSQIHYNGQANDHLNQQPTDSHNHHPSKRPRTSPIYTGSASGNVNDSSTANNGSASTSSNMNGNYQSENSIKMPINANPKLPPQSYTSPITPVDTTQFSNILRTRLIAEKIGQRLFAKEIGGITQSALSDMLLKPKPWAECTDYKKRLYHKMSEWMKNPAAIESLRLMSIARDQRAMNGFSMNNGHGGSEEMNEPPLASNRINKLNSTMPAQLSSQNQLTNSNNCTVQQLCKILFSM